LVKCSFGRALVPSRLGIGGHSILLSRLCSGRVRLVNRDPVRGEGQQAIGVRQFEDALHRSPARPDRKDRRLSEAEFVQPQHAVEPDPVDERQFPEIEYHVSDRGEIDLVEFRLEEWR
jgi:hypothetical protein